MVERLRLDPGTRTLGELLQEREWALNEIERLRNQLSRVAQINRPSESPSDRPAARPPVDAAITAHRLLKLTEVCELAGLGRSSIYRLTAEARFPAPVRVSDRCVRWRMADVLQWQARTGSRGTD